MLSLPVRTNDPVVEQRRHTLGLVLVDELDPPLHKLFLAIAAKTHALLARRRTLGRQVHAPNLAVL